jgi:hypothetical protein
MGRTMMRRFLEVRRMVDMALPSPAHSASRLGLRYNRSFSGYH